MFWFTDLYFVYKLLSKGYFNEVFDLAYLLGEDEDFDGLITALQDME